MAIESINKARVYVSSVLVGPDEPQWVEQPHLRILNLTRGQSPTIDQGSLLWLFGTMERESDFGSDTAMGVVAPLDIKGKYVHIVEENLPVDWYGYILSDEIDRGPAEGYGNQTFGIVGLEWFLSRKTIHSSNIDFTTVQRAIGFNAGFGDGRGVTYETRANRNAIANNFANSPEGAALWSAHDEAEYLLGYHGPRDAASNYSPIEFELHESALSVLAGYHPTAFTEGRSIWQVLNDIISQNRGLSWRLDPYYGIFFNEFHIVLKVTSMATSAISLPGGGAIPAADSQIALDDIETIDFRPQIRRDLSRKHDNVVCRGARRRAVFTVSMTSENLEIGWRAADETDYKTAVGSDPKVNDRFRQAHRFERVYQVFQIPADWNGASNDGGSVPTTTWACPKLAQGSASIIASEPISMPGLRLLPTMPIKVGYSYANATAPTARDPADVAPEWQRPFAVIDISSDDSGLWRFIHELSTTDEDSISDLRSFSMRMLDSAPGVQFHPPDGMPHSLALNHFDPEVDAVSEHDPKVDYEKTRCTVAGEWDAYCEGKYPAADGSGEPLQTLYISIGERARHDWMAQGTIYDIENGALQTVTTGGALRDDRNLCVDIARIAYEWYGVERAQVSIATTKASLPVDLGDLITTIGTGASQETVNALVSQITYDFEAGRTTILAGFAELDFAALV